MSTSISLSDSVSSSSLDSYYSDMSTPSKRGVVGLPENATRSTIRPSLEDDIKNKIFLTDVKPFVQHVWGVDEATINLICEGMSRWAIEPDALRRYNEKTNDETELYPIFAEIAEDLIAKVHAFVKCAGKSSVVFWNKGGTCKIKSRFTPLQPDMLTLAEVIERPVWLMPWQIIEFKKKRRLDADRKRRTVASSTSSALPPHIRSSGRPSKRVPSSSLAAKRHAKATLSVEPVRRSQRITASSTSSRGTPIPSGSVVPSQTTSQKRKNNEDIGSQRASKRRNIDYTQDELQLATYALECMTSSTRLYTSGIFIDRTFLSLWYYDSACIIRTLAFNFTEFPTALALVVYALSTCDRKHAGFDPCMEIHNAPADDANGVGLPHIVGSRMTFPLCNDSGDSLSWTVQKILFEYHGLIGRATKVYSAFPDGGTEPEALKLSWPLVSRQKESVVIKKVVDALPDWRDHLPEVTFSATHNAEYLDLPRVELLKSVPTTEFEDRELHAIAMKLYKKLWEVDDVEEFKKAFVDCVECHYQAYTVAKVLHRDLSENNLMFKRKEGEVKGIVNDWDMASILNDAGEVPTSAAKHRTGTIPFMARDLLVENPPPHLYRHDLESFFFVLVWAAIHYDLKNKARLDIVKRLEKWNAEISVALDAKVAFIMETSEDVLEFVREDMRELLQWIDPLLDLFRAATLSRPKRRDVKAFAEYDNATYGGRLTFHTFMAAIEQAPRSSLS